MKINDKKMNKSKIIRQDSAIHKLKELFEKQELNVQDLTDAAIFLKIKSGVWRRYYLDNI